MPRTTRYTDASNAVVCGVSLGQNEILIGAVDQEDENGGAYIFFGISDCNDNDSLDICDIEMGKSDDVNNNGIPDECECTWDLDGSGSVDTGDLLALFAQWGTDGTADFDDDGTVNTVDLLILFANWGPCP